MIALVACSLAGGGIRPLLALPVDVRGRILQAAAAPGQPVPAQPPVSRPGEPPPQSAVPEMPAVEQPDDESVATEIAGDASAPQTPTVAEATGDLELRVFQARITITRRAATTVSIDLPTRIDYEVERVADPERIIIELKGIGLDAAGGTHVTALDDPRIAAVRANGTAPGRLRIVLDLTQDAARASHSAYQTSDGRGVVIEVRNAAPVLSVPTVRAEPAVTAAPGPAPTPSPAPPAATASAARPPAPIAINVTPPPADTGTASTPTPATPAPVAPTASVASSPRPTTTGPAANAVSGVPPVRPFELPPRIGILYEASLSLREALYMALANNPEVQELRADQEASIHEVMRSRGAYDPVLATNGSYQKREYPVSSSLSGTNTGSVLNRTWQVSPSISGASPRFGGSYDVGFTGQRFSTSDLFATLNPNYPTLLTFQYAQPLWRNLRYDARRHGLEVARRNQQTTDERFRRRVMETVQKTEEQYWELSFARRDLAVQLEGLEIARRQDESARRQLQLGLVAPIDIVAAQTQVANFELAVYAAQEALTRAENALKSTTLGNRLEKLWTAALVPTTAPDTRVPPVDLAAAVDEALRQRPEATELKFASEINRATQRLHSEELKPRVDFIAQHTRAGLSGRDVTGSTPSPLLDSLTPAIARLNVLSAAAGLDPVGVGASATVPDLLVGGYGRSFDNLFSSNFPGWLAEVRVSVPLRNRTAKANLGESITEASRLEFRRRAVEQAIEADVRNALQGIDSARQRLDAARLKHESAKEQFYSEQRQFRAGVSSLFLVQERQLAMVTSLRQVHRAETDLSEAISRFELARGVNYQRHDIKLK